MEPSSSGRPTRSLPKQWSSAEFPHNERVRCPCRDDGGGEIVRFFARLDLGTAFATLIRQRHPMPSCGGLTPTAKRTVDPARTIEESLTSDPGIREHNRPKANIADARKSARFTLRSTSAGDRQFEGPNLGAIS